MANFIIIALLLLVIGAAVRYIIKAKKKGVKCIGCPAGANCHGKSGDTVQCYCKSRPDTKTEDKE